MKKTTLGLIAAAGIAGSVLAASYTPVTREAYRETTQTITNTEAVAIGNVPVLQLTTAYGTTSTNTLSAVSTSLVGRVVTMVNVGTNAILFAEASPLISAGNITLGQYDNITILIRATNELVEVGRVNN